ncbi:MAG: uroporphyrinogen-III C-methyltransferase [Pseudomonadota bacterium]
MTEAKIGTGSGSVGQGEAPGTATRHDTPKVLDELSKHNSAKPMSLRRHNGLRRFMIIVVMLIPVVLFMAWLTIEQARTEAALEELRLENQTLQSTLVNPVTAAPGLDPQLLDDLRLNLEARIEALTSTVNDTTAGLQAQLSVTPPEGAARDWLWTESEYLLRLANQKLQLEGDTESALLLLTTVDRMLSQEDDPALFPVREALAADIVAVRSMEAIDIAGLYVRLNNVMPIIERLSLRNALVQNYTAQLPGQPGSQSAGQSVAAQSASAESGLLARGLEILGSIFVWQRWDVAPEALLPAPQEAMLKQNLRLMLEQAQLALLMSEEAVYRDSLAKGSDWAARYFAIDAGAGRTLTEELRTLSSERIAQVRPDISGSLEALLQVSENRLPPLSDGN